MLCTLLYHICFIRVLDGGHWLIVCCYNGSWYKRLKTIELEKHFSILHDETSGDSSLLVGL